MPAYVLFRTMSILFVPAEITCRDFRDFQAYRKGNFHSSVYVYVPHALLVYVHLCICQGVGELEKYENVLVLRERTVGCKSSLKVAALS